MSIVAVHGPTMLGDGGSGGGGTPTLLSTDQDSLTQWVETTLTLTGTGFTEDSTVTVGPYSRQSTTFISDTEMTVTFTLIDPAEVMNIRVANGSTRSNALPLPVTLVPGPEVTSITPMRIDPWVENTLTVNGGPFTSESEVVLSSATPVVTTFVSETELTFNLTSEPNLGHNVRVREGPPGSPMSDPVQVTTGSAARPNCLYAEPNVYQDDGGVQTFRIFGEKFWGGLDEPSHAITNMTAKWANGEPPETTWEVLSDTEATITFDATPLAGNYTWSIMAWAGATYGDPVAIVRPVVIASLTPDTAPAGTEVAVQVRGVNPLWGKIEVNGVLAPVQSSNGNGMLTVTYTPAAAGTDQFVALDNWQSDYPVRSEPFPFSVTGGTLTATAGQPGTWTPDQGANGPKYISLPSLDVTWEPTDDWRHSEYVHAEYMGYPAQVQANPALSDGYHVTIRNIDAVGPSTYWLEPTITAQDQANADKLAALGYVPYNPAPWPPTHFIAVVSAPVEPGELGLQFTWDGTQWIDRPPAPPLTLTSTTPATVPTGMPDPIIWTGTGFIPQSGAILFACRLETDPPGTVVMSFMADNDTLTDTYAETVSGFSTPGNYLLYVTNTFTGETSAEIPLEVTLNPPPVLTSITPSTAVVGAPATVTLVGENFGYDGYVVVDGTVDYGGVIYGVVRVSDTEMTMSLPPDVAGTYQIGVVNSGPWQFSAALPYTVTAAARSTGKKGKK